MAATRRSWLFTFNWVQRKSNQKFSLSVVPAPFQMLTSRMGTDISEGPGRGVLLQDPRIPDDPVEGHPPPRDIHEELHVRASNFC